MKKLFLALFAMTFLFAGGAFAQEEITEPATDEATEYTEEATEYTEEATDEVTASADAQEIQFDALPDAVKSAFEGSDYAMWQVQTVYEMPAPEGTESAMYEISVTDGTTEETVTYNAEGEQM